VAPTRLAPLNRAWTALSLILFRIVNPLVLGIMFFLVVLPIGLLMRLFGKDPLRLMFDREAPTYWIDKEPLGPAKETMRNQF
ncbi:MAG: SxtJ family membrane protein, partial [Planctomycetota bacterium]